MAQECATHMFGSLYGFSVAARDEILKSFEAKGAPDVSCECGDGQHFIIRCPKNNDASLFEFIKFIRGFIEEQIDKKPEIFEEPKITRVKGTRPKTMDDSTSSNNAVSGTHVPAAAEMASQCLMPVKHQLAEFHNHANAGILINHETVTRTWTPDKSGREIGSKLSDYVMSKIGSICHCCVEWSDDTVPEVKVKGDSERDVERAISKLTTMNEVTIKQMTFPHVINFLISEGEVSFTLQMMAIRELKDRRSFTTLLSSTEPIFNFLENSLVIILLKGGSIVPVKQTVYKGTAKGLLWKDHPYKPFNVPVDQGIEMSSTPNGAYDSTPTTAWVTEIPIPSEMEDPFMPDTKYQVEMKAQLASKQAAETTYKQPLDPAPVMKHSTKRTRAVKGATKASIAKAEIDLEMVETETTSQNTYINRHGSIVRNPANHAPRHNAVVITKESAAGNLIIDAFQNSSVFCDELHELVPDQIVQEDGIEDKPFTKQISSAKENRPTVIEQPEIATPYMPPTPATREPSQNSGRSDAPNSAWEARPIRGRAGLLIDIMPQDQPRGSSNVQSRDVKHTMGQKAPSLLSAGNTPLIKEIEEAAKQLLALALHRPGPVVFEIGIGRLLVNHQTGPTEFKTKPFTTSEWSSVFPRKPGAERLETIFTPRLTTSLLDAESILDVCLSQGRRLFDIHCISNPLLRNVTYVFLCKSKKGDRITVNVNEEGAFTVLGPEVLIGSLDFHFPKRSWDASLRLKTSALCSTDYKQQIECIVRNLKISVSRNRTATNLSTQAIDDELVIDNIVLRRETAHPSRVYPDLMLHLCEVQDLQVHREEGQYQGSVEDRIGMAKASRLWWEASIKSVNVNSALNENESLELGERVTWNANTVVSTGVVSDMFALAEKIVTNIDHVGFHNKGARGSSDSQTQTRSYQTSQKSSKVAVGGSGYW